jgi:hypothetical protein
MVAVRLVPAGLRQIPDSVLALTRSILLPPTLLHVGKAKGDREGATTECRSRTVLRHLLDRILLPPTLLHVGKAKGDQEGATTDVQVMPISSHPEWAGRATSRHISKSLFRETSAPHTVTCRQG